MSDYRNIFVDHMGRMYRVTFYVPLNRVMLVGWQRMGRPGRETINRGGHTERYLNIEGRAAKPIIAFARVKLNAAAASPLGSERT